MDSETSPERKEGVKGGRGGKTRTRGERTCNMEKLPKIYQPVSPCAQKTHANSPLNACTRLHTKNVYIYGLYIYVHIRNHTHLQQELQQPVPNYKSPWQGINLIQMGWWLIYEGSKEDPYPPVLVSRLSPLAWEVPSIEVAPGSFTWSHPLIHFHQSSIASFACFSCTPHPPLSPHLFICLRWIWGRVDAFDRGVSHAVFATGPLRHLPKLCFRCQQDERDLVIFCSFPSSFHLPSICHPSTTLLVFRRQE